MTNTALVVFEHLITIDREIEVFWKQKFSIAKALFIINRYLILLDATLRLVSDLDIRLAYRVSHNVLIGLMRTHNGADSFVSHQV